MNEKQIKACHSLYGHHSALYHKAHAVRGIRVANELASALAVDRILLHDTVERYAALAHKCLIEEKEAEKKMPSQSPLICATKSNNGYRITFHNDVYLGDVEPDIDGYYKFWPNNRAGYWDSTHLRDISDLLEHLNAEWDKQVQRECGFESTGL